VEVVSEKQVGGIQARLLAWFERNRRDFPWRHSHNPYTVLVTEKLLQQTAARDSVVKAFHDLTTLYPSVSELADADDAELERILAPLGFHYRAKELKVLASTLLEEHGGSIPAELNQLKALPGIGDYMARAVLSFAYGQDIAVVDTNVARFLYRVFAIAGRLHLVLEGPDPLHKGLHLLVGRQRPLDLALDAVGGQQVLRHGAPPHYGWALPALTLTTNESRSDRHVRPRKVRKSEKWPLASSGTLFFGPAAVPWAFLSL
jgi:endonuclease III